jgi:hypothetical protein
MDTTVVVSVRPINQRELGQYGKQVVTSEAQQQITIENPSNHYKKNVDVDKVIWNSTQEHPQYTTHDGGCNELADMALSNLFGGKDTALLSYGITTSGKTHLLRGNQDGYTTGVVEKLVLNLFHRIRDETIDGTSFKVLFSLYEIYNEKIFDIQAASNHPNGLRVRQDSGDPNSYIENLIQKPVECAMDIIQILDNVLAKHLQKSRGYTYSQQAHIVYEIVVQKQSPDFQRVNKLSIVDLAGSESKKLNGAYDIRNSGLVTLEKIVGTMKQRETKKTVIPVRNSKLTFALKETLLKGKVVSTFKYSIIRI